MGFRTSWLFRRISATFSRAPLLDDPFNPGEGVPRVYFVSTANEESRGMAGYRLARKPAWLTHNAAPLPRLATLVMKGSPVRVRASALLISRDFVTGLLSTFGEGQVRARVRILARVQ